MRSIVYWHPLIYSFLIRLSYGRGYTQRYKAISDLIEDNSSVIDVCCGDCKIFSYLKGKNIDYLGLDFNPYFIRSANKRKIKASLFDVYKDKVPSSDYFLIQGSLYQFVPKHTEIIKKLVDAAKKYVIISEPVKNKAHSKSKIVSFIAEKLSDPGDGIKKYKFNAASFHEALRPFRNCIIKEFLAANGIDYIAVIKK